MSIARHHAEWLSLLEVSGPFLSLPVLIRTFPNGLEARDVEQAQELKLAYADWSDRGQRESSVHRLWVRYVLEKVLGYSPELLVEGATIPPGMEARMSEYGETLKPDYAVVHRATGEEKPDIALLIQVYPPNQELDSPVKDRTWKASPDTRMAELLHGAGVPLGLVTNGERWMLVHAPRGETSGFASWYGDLWMQEPLVLRSFYSLLNSQRLIGVSVGERLVDLLAESAKDQQEVTDQLGYQVRKAVEVFVNALDRIDQDTNRELLKEVPEKAIYDGALTVMMRLVFLFKAEETGLLLLGDEVYDENYAVSTLRDQLRERADQHGEEILERRSDAWCRLLATFRAVYSGTQHDTMRLPPYGGTLFDPDRYPFLEGRNSGSTWRDASAQPLSINNRVVLHLLEALQILRVKVPGGGPAEPRRLSFRSLDIEQIGHIYEGLLDHTAFRASEVILGLAGGRDTEPEVALAELERLQKDGGEKLMEFLKEQTGRSGKALEKALSGNGPSETLERGLSIGGDTALAERLHPFHGLLRQDNFGQWVVVKPGGIYVTRGSDRRSTGTHYTPRSLTEPIVQHTLEPLVYVGPAEGKPKEEWQLKSPKEILALKVCDMAMGSGAFLVQACRYLAERLVEAWEKIEKAHPGLTIITPEGDVSQGSPTERLLPVDQAERITIARRFIADRCLYGVDTNPMAAEMAKLSLWLITLQRDRPFSFLNHSLKCGDSLLGVSSLKQIENFSLRPGGRQVTFATANLFSLVEDASAKRRALEEMPSNDHSQIEAKNRLHAEAEAATTRVKALADCLIAMELHGLDGDAYEGQRTAEAERVQLLMKRDDDAQIETSNAKSELASAARKALRGRRTFHWPVEFPEVFARGGFDAFVGNPPFMGGKQMPTFLSPEYCSALKLLFSESKGAADLVAFFFRRTFALLTQSGCTGLLSTKSISETVSRAVGLEPIAVSGGIIYRACSAMPWPGDAAVVVAKVHLRNGGWKGAFDLDGRTVTSISTSLTEAHDFASAHRLHHGILYSEGTKLYGDSFVRPSSEVPQLLSANPGLAKYLRPHVNGDVLNGSPNTETDSVVIDFGELDEKELQGCNAILAELKVQVANERANQTRQIHEHRPWLHWDKRTDFFQHARQLPRILACVIVSTNLAFTFVDPKKFFVHGIKLFADPRASLFACLQSAIHEVWVRGASSKLGDSNRYSTSTSFDMFPLIPAVLDSTSLSEVGERYHKLRREIMQTRQEGLTKTYNRFHERGEQSADIARLRALHVEMDQAVAAAYGWSDLVLDHGFHATKQGERYTLSETARRTVLDRLLALNHQCYEEELKAGLHEKGTRGARKGTRKNHSSILDVQETLIPAAQKELF